MGHISRLNELVQPRPLRIHLTDLSLQEQLLFPQAMISIIDIIYIFIRYDLLLLSNHTLFLIIISSNQFYTSLQQQLSFPRDYYQYINVIFPWKNNHYSLLINQLSPVLPISSVPEKNNRYILLIFISIIYIIFPRKKL